MDKYQKEGLLLVSGYVIVIAVFVFLALFLSGCSMFPVNENPDVIPDADQLVQVVKQTNWLATLSIIGIGAGFFSFLNGGTRGLQAMASCFVILSIVLGVAKYSAWIAGISMAGAVGLMLYTAYIKNRALKEVVGGAEGFISDDDTQATIVSELLAYFDTVQSPLTKKLVDSIQKSLGVKK